MNRWKQLIERFWKGETTKVERADLLDYLEHQEDEIRAKHRKEFEGEEEVTFPDKLHPERKQELLRQIQAKIAFSEDNMVQKQAVHVQTLRKVAAVAAVLVLGCFIAYFWKQGGRARQKAVLAIEDSLVVKTNQSDKMIVFVLPDSSKVSLEPGSRIAYHRQFNRLNRDIELQGNAVFNVFKNPDLPFRVKARGYFVTALGTIFRVHAGTGKTMKVHLYEGKVVVHAELDGIKQGEEYLMSPGDELAIDVWKHTVEKQVSVAPSVSAVRHPETKQQLQAAIATGKSMTVLRFDETPLPTVLAQIAKVYHKEIVLKDEALSQRRYTGRLYVDAGISADSLSHMLSLLLASDPYHYAINEHQIVLSTNKEHKF